MNRVTHVEAQANYRLLVRMEDGREGTFDVSGYFRSPFFDELRDERYFALVKRVFRGVGWPNGQDLGPDTISAGLVEKPRKAIVA